MQQRESGWRHRLRSLAGGSSIAAVGGDLPAGSANTSCTITVNVVASVEGTYTNGPGNVVTPLIATEATTLAVTPAQAETLTLAQKVGSLSLSLRSLADAGRPPEPPEAQPGEAAMAQTPEPGLTVVRFGVARQQTP